jgi:hypothetical protein
MNYAGKGFAPANKSCDASWASVYPSVVYSTMRTEGDTSHGRWIRFHAHVFRYGDRGIAYENKMGVHENDFTAHG